ncbi:MAG: heme o synthase [Armatimonadota bacterium]|nr:heme o synthase [bacterium]MDW8319828.1 heme o synthase [Armatimonadota bacterium]
MKSYAVMAGETVTLTTAWSLPSLVARLAAIWQLSKPRVTLLVWLSALAAMWLPGKPVSLSLFLITAAGVWLVVASANGWNQVLEWRCDARMRRTARRPIPSGRLSPLEAAVVSTIWGTAGVLLLWYGVNPLTSLLGTFALLVYVLVYTPSKRHTAWCTVIGAVPGAIPPVMGWTAAGGQMNWQALLLFAVQFLWQFPHFWAIAWKYRQEYREAGFHLVPFGDEAGMRVGWAMLTASALLLAISIAPALVGWRSWWYATGALSLGAWMLWSTVAFLRRRDNRSALKVMFTSLGYLPLWFMLLLLTR